MGRSGWCGKASDLGGPESEQWVKTERENCGVGMGHLGRAKAVSGSTPKVLEEQSEAAVARVS